MPVAFIRERVGNFMSKKVNSNGKFVKISRVKSSREQSLMPIGFDFSEKHKFTSLFDSEENDRFRAIKLVTPDGDVVI